MRFRVALGDDGFVNALAILIFVAQNPELVGPPPPRAVADLRHGRRRPWHSIYLLPRVTKAIPSPLVAIRPVDRRGDRLRLRCPHGMGDMGALPDTLPVS